MAKSDAIRRGLDVAIAASVLTVATPLMALIGAAIKFDSPGPAYFHQRRVGKDGRGFYISKFRTMCVSHDGIAVSTTGDTRVTKVGKFLRKTKLDELPQLFNVLHGDMALVGPRPEVPQYAKLWPKEVAQTIISVRPGITDPVSVRLRNEADILAEADDPEDYYTNVLLPEKAHAYADYIHSRSLSSDAKVLVDTLKAIIAS